MLRLAEYFNMKNEEAASAMWYQKAADMGSAEAYFQLGLYYMQGYGVEKNLTRAFKETMQAARRGNASAQFNIASFYKHGIGTQPNKEQALYWYQQSVKNNPSHAETPFENL